MAGSAFSGLATYGVVVLAAVAAFAVRMVVIARYELTLRDNDPFFNLRSTQRVVDFGVNAGLAEWFDATSWYPHGRHVGDTTHPGLVLFTAGVHTALRAFGLQHDLADLCALMPPILSTVSTVAMFVLGNMVQGTSTGLFSACLFSIVPAYVSHSIAGSFDSDCIAMPALIVTCCCWLKAIEGSKLSACAAAVLYAATALSWGGFVFVSNLIALHVLVLLVLGRCDRHVKTAYSLFFVLGTGLSLHIAFIGTKALCSPELLLPLCAFVVVQLVDVVWGFFAVTTNSIATYAFFALASAVALWLVFSTSLDGWTARTRSALDPTYARAHSPILASVSENQPTAWASFYFDLQLLVFLVPLGWHRCFADVTKARVFVVLFGLTTLYFAGVMSKQMMLLAPSACLASAIALDRLFQTYMQDMDMTPAPTSSKPAAKSSATPKKKPVKNGVKRSAGSGDAQGFWSTTVVFLVVMALVFYAVHCVWVVAQVYAAPTLFLSSTQANGTQKVFDDFREAYGWVQNNTPHDSKVLAWWDYGYQISAMGNRTTVIDNNTNNLTHVGLVGLAFASGEAAAFSRLRELGVDYVMVWFGGMAGFGSDDINKFVWMLRAAQAVSDDSPVNEANYFSLTGELRVDAEGAPALKQSLLYKLCYYRFRNVYTEAGKPRGWDRVRRQEVGVTDIDLEYFEEVHTTENWLVRVYRLKDALNRGLPVR